MRSALVLLVLTALLTAAASGAVAAPAVTQLVPGTPCVKGDQRHGPTFSTDPADVPLDGTVVVSPDRVETTGPLAPGTVMTCSITIRSRHKQRTTYQLVPQGVLGDGASGVTYLDPDAPEAAATAGRWLAPAVDEISLPPRGVATVAVLVAVPVEPPSGAAYASLNVVSRTEVADQAGAQLGIESQIAVQFLLQTDSEARRALSISDVAAPRVRFSRQPWTLTARVKNIGTIHGAARGRVHVRSIFGNEVARLPVQSRPLLPEASAPLEVTWRGVPWLGVYRTELRLDRAADGTEVATPVRGWLVALPPWWVLALVVLLAAGMAARRMRRRRDYDAEAFAAVDDADDADVDEPSDEPSAW